MKFKIYFKTIGELFDEGAFDSENEKMTVDAAVALHGGPGWREKLSQRPIVISGSTFEEAVDNARREVGIDLTGPHWQLRIKNYIEFHDDRTMSIWDQYYCAALTGLLASEARPIPAAIQKYERWAAESADRMIKRRRAEMGDL